MKRNFIVSIYCLAVIAIILTSCKRKAVDHTHMDRYQLTIDSDLSKLLNSVNQEVIGKIAIVKAEVGSQLLSMEVPGRITYDTRNETGIASRVGGRIERLMIKYNYQPIKKGALIMEIYSPDLVSAQRELILIAKSGAENALLRRAKQRLLLLGMQSAQIEHVLKTGMPLYNVPVYSPVSGFISEKNSVSNQLPVLLREGQYVKRGESMFNIYKAGNLIAEFSLQPKVSAFLKRGSEILIEGLAGSDDLYKEKIGIIEPILQDGVNFNIARVSLKENSFYAGQLVKAHIPISIQGGWWLPQEAVWQTGDHSIVFKNENHVFRPYQVNTGAKINGMVQIMEDISDWNIAANCYYLIDSESFIRASSPFKDSRVERVH